MIEIFSNIRNQIISFINSDKQRPILAAMAAGLYPMLFYYNSNFTLVNSWNQLANFVLYYLLVPIITFCALKLVFEKIKILNGYKKYLLSVINFILFVFLIILGTYGFRKKILILAILMAFGLGYLLYKHLNRIIVFQFLLALFLLAKLVPDLLKEINYDNSWVVQSDNIERTIFKKRPNIYVIQPDGYANFSELKKGHYKYDNNIFERFLEGREFKLYNDYRSNYYSTLSTNSSMFAMKHHYYNNVKQGSTELYKAREGIVGENPVLSIFKNNNYKTFLLLEKSYLIVNRPKIYFDYCNVDFSELSFMARGFEIDKNINEDLERVMDNNQSTSNFYFIEKLLPGHINVYSKNSKGKETERINYLKDLEKSNEWMMGIIELIIDKDKNSLIVIAADHGGFVGMNHTLESHIKQTDKDLISSIFTSALAIRWPESPPEFDNKLKTSVNLFRVLFSYLSEDQSYLTCLQDDRSYIKIEKGAPPGVYEYINQHGEIVFNPIMN